MESEYFFDY